MEQHDWVYFPGKCNRVHSVLLLVEQTAQKQLYKNRWVAVVAPKIGKCIDISENKYTD